MSTLSEIEAAADALPLEQKRELISFLASRVQDQSAAAMDLSYERGYLENPEDIALTNALLPHLTGLGSWE